MTAPARLLRLDGAAWDRLALDEGLVGAALITMGAYAVLAFDRFGPQAFFEPRATVRFLLTGFYGWLWLAAAAWVIGRITQRSRVRFEPVFRLFGHAHLPILVLAITIQVASVLFRLQGPALLVVGFVVSFWMPAALVAASRVAFDVGTRTAILIVVGPYVVWLLVVGPSLAGQLGHLV